jgi:uncharacterized protein (TIGR02466 family)
MVNIDLIQVNATPIMKFLFDPLCTKEDITLLMSQNFVNPFNSENDWSESKQLLLNPGFSELKEKFDSCIREYVNVLGVDQKFKMTNSWVTKNDPGHQHRRHYHPNVMIAATGYFVPTEYKNDFQIAPVTFDCYGLSRTFRDFNFDMTIKNDNLLNAKRFTVEPKNNELLVFPGYMYHWPEKNPSNKPRYCIAANYFIEDSMGHDDNYNYININIST